MQEDSERSDNQENLSHRSEDIHRHKPLQLFDQSKRHSDQEHQHREQNPLELVHLAKSLMLQRAHDLRKQNH